MVCGLVVCDLVIGFAFTAGLTHESPKDEMANSQKVKWRKEMGKKLKTKNKKVTKVA